MRTLVSSPSRLLISLITLSVIFGSTAFAVGSFNTPESGYVLCINKKTSGVSFPGTENCPKGSTRLQIGAQGQPGVKGEQGDLGPTGINGLQGLSGAQGVAGINGANGLNGASLLTGVGDPNNQLGNDGDTYIDKNGAYIFGPKKSGLWGNPTAFGGARGATGPKGDTGASGLASYFIRNLPSGENPNLVAGQPLTVYQSQFPAGKYLLSFKMRFMHDSSFVTLFSCSLPNNNSEENIINNAILIPPGYNLGGSPIYIGDYSIDGHIEITDEPGPIKVTCTFSSLGGPAPENFFLFGGSLQVLAVSELIFTDASPAFNVTSLNSPSPWKNLSKIGGSLVRP